MIQLNIAEHVLLEDPYILVVNKPCGLMVEPDRNNHPNLLHQVQKYVKATISKGEEAYAQHIHRLDRPVSGIVLFAKQKSVLKNLSEQFAERKVKKQYLALTDRGPSVMKGTLEHWHRKEKKKAMLYDEEVPYAEKAILRYKASVRRDGKFVWEIELHTGKFHQIRAQLASIGCPIIGDALYGSPLTYKQDAIALHAYRLDFFHPVSGLEIRIEKKADF